MNKGYPYAHDAARLKFRPLPHQQLLITLLLTITLVSIALIAVYDNHAFVQTKIREFRSRLPSVEYPMKIQEYQSKYYDYENIVHEHVHEKNVKIDENYIDIDYKVDDENTYEAYSDEDVDTKPASEDVLEGAGFRTYGGFRNEKEYEDVNNEEVIEQHRSETENTPKAHGTFDNIYDETDGANDDSTRSFDRTTNEVGSDGSSRTVKNFQINENNVKDEKTDSLVGNKSDEIDVRVDENVLHSSEITKENINSSNNGSDYEVVVGDITNLAQIDGNERNENASNKINKTSNGLLKHIESTNNKWKESNSNDSLLIVEVGETMNKDTNENQTENAHSLNKLYKATYKRVHKTEKYVDQNITTDNLSLSNKNSTHSLSNTTVSTNNILQPSTTPETTTKPNTYDIFKYPSRTIGSNFTSPLTKAGFDSPFKALFKQESGQFSQESNQLFYSPSRFFGHPKRRLPQALIIGVRKCGTRALLEMLYLHPRIQKAAGEVHFFDRDENYAKGLEWYRQQMPPSYPNQVTIEKSPSYFVTPEAPERIRAMNASVRLLVIVRDPVTRAISDYTQLKIHSPAPVKKFETLALREDGEINENYRPIAVSMYHNFMYAWYEVFAKDQILVVNGDRLIEDPVPELQRIERFLNLEPRIRHDNFYFNRTKGFYCLKNRTSEKCLRESKGRKHVRVHPKVIAKMHEYFNVHNQLFYDLVEEDFDWPEE